MSEDMEYTITTRPLPPAIPIESIRELALVVNELAHGQNYHAGIILRWLARMEDDAGNETDSAG